MPRSVTLSNGKVIVNVPDDVTDEEVEAKVARQKEALVEAEPEEPTPEPMPEPEEETSGVGFDFRRVLARTQASLMSTGVDVISGLLPSEEREVIQRMSGDIGTALATQAAPELVDPETGRVSETETLTGKIAEIAPYIAVGSRIQGAKAMQQAPRFVQSLMAGVATDQLLADEDENIFNFIEDTFSETAVADVAAFLATDEDDTEVEKRLKLIGEGLGLGVISDLVIAGGGSAIDLARTARQKFNKNYRNLNPEEQGEVFVDYLKESRERAGLRNREDRVELNETPEGAAQVQQQKSSRLNRIFRQLFTSRGYFTNNAKSAFDNAQYAQRAAVSRAEHIATRLTKAMNEMVESSDSNISERVQEALTSTKLADLSKSDRKLALMDIQEEFGFSPEVAEEVLNARELIDQFSRDITGSSNIPLELKEIIAENMGSYMRRSYRLFEDTGYKPSEDVVDDAREYLVNLKMSADETLTEEEAYKQAEVTIAQILDRGGAVDRSAAGEYYANAKRINKEILKGKEEISPEIRALMGEIENPADNIVLAVSKMAKFAETSKFYSTLDRLGQQGNYIFTEDNVPIDLVKKENIIQGTNSSLDGKYTTPEIIKAIKQNESFISAPEAQNAAARAYREFLRLKGTSQALKTVFSVTTQFRNLLGGLQFGTANGLKPYEFSGAATTLKNQILKSGDATLDELYEKYLKLGIINTNVRVGEFRSLLDTSYDTYTNPENLLKKLKLDKVAKYGGKPIQFVEDLYVATDDLFKISAYNQELDTLKKAFPDESIDVLEEEAARKIRDTLPNYDRVPKGIKSLRNAPIGSFVSFPAEVIRTSGNIIREASREITSGNSVLRARGLDRLGGFAVTNSAWYAAGSATAKLIGLNEEDQKAAQTLTETPWSKDSPKIFLKADDKIFTSDTQFLDSYSVIKEPLMAAYREIRDGKLQGESLDKYIADAGLTAVGTLVRPYVDQTILTKSLTDVGFAMVGSGRTPEGKALFTANMPTGEKWQNGIYHILESFKPGAYEQVFENLAEAVKDVPNAYTGKYKYVPAEIAAMLGVRFTELDPDNIIRYAVSDYRRGQQGLESITPDYRTKGEELVGDYVNREKALYRNAQEFSRKIEASIDLIGTGETIEYLNKHGLSNKEIAQIISGMYLPREISMDLIKESYEKIDLSPGESIGEVLRNTFRKYSEMIGTRLQQPEEDSELRRTLFNIGGEVYDVPQAPVEPDERIDRMTGLPYNLQAGGAFIDEEEREGFSGGGRVVVKLLADVIQNYSKRNVSEDAALSAADRIVSAIDQNAEFMPELSTANPKYVEFLETNTRALLDEKHTPIPEEITAQAGEGGQEFSRLRGYTDEEFEVFSRSNQIADELKEETGVDLMDETYMITNELDNIRARDMDYGELDEGMSVENQIADIELEYAESLEAARFGGDIEEYEAILKEKNDRIKALDIPEDQMPPQIRQPRTISSTIPEVKEAYENLQAGKITTDEYDKIVNNTVYPYASLPLPETEPSIIRALGKKAEKLNAAIKKGLRVGLRLDINAYKNYDTWVPTIHDDKGKAIGYQSTASVKNVDFTMANVKGKFTAEEKAQRVMEGTDSKTPFAQIMGDYVDRTEEENFRAAQEAFNSDEWIQVGFDPRRHSFFYDRVTGQPVEFADEVIQIGPLVLAKNAKYGDRSKYKYNEGGKVLKALS